MSGYGGALSVNFGLTAGQELLDVSFLDVVLLRNVFTSCVVNVRTRAGGNAYGGATSIYMGAYSSSLDGRNNAIEAGVTVVRNVSVTLRVAQFLSCGSIRSAGVDDINGGNTYGGSFSFYIGAYAWSRSLSDSPVSSSSSTGATNVSSVSVVVSEAPCIGCSAVTTTEDISSGANSYGGSLSALHIGAYSFSFSRSGGSSSTCSATIVSGVSVRVSNSACINCSSVANSESASFQSSSYGGSISAVYIGAYSFSRSQFQRSSSSIGSTSADGVSVIVNSSSCFNCTAATNSRFDSFAVSSYGGSMSAIHIGAYSFSQSSTNVIGSGSSSTLGALIVRNVSVIVSNSSCFSCSAATTCGRNSLGASSYGGSISAVHIASYAWSFSTQGGFTVTSSSSCDLTRVVGLAVLISRLSVNSSVAISGQPIVVFKFCTHFSVSLDFVSQTLQAARLAPPSVIFVCFHTF